MSSASIIIFCGGMVRSGSTWSFNVCRSILQAADRPFISGYFGEEKDVDIAIQNPAIDPSQSLIIKAHIPGQASLQMIRDGKVKNIFTYRDPRDIICSRLKFENREFESILSVTVQNLRMYDWYRQSSETLFVRFESMMSDPISEIKKIANYLNIELDEIAVRRIAHQNSLEESQKAIDNLQNLPKDSVLFEDSRRIDRDTLLQTGHINGAQIGRWKNELNAEQQLLSHLAFQPWLIELDYETEESWSQLLLDVMKQTNWQHQAQAYWYRGDYHSAASLYEPAVELEPNILSHYWHLGLMLLLKGEEEEAQSIWLSVMLEAEPEEVEDWTAELVKVLETEAQRRSVLEDYQIAWVIRKHIQEIVPNYFTNLLHLIKLCVRLEFLFEQEYIVGQATEYLQESTTDLVDEHLLQEVFQELLDFAPDLDSVIDFVRVYVERIAHSSSLAQIFLDKTAALLQQEILPKRILSQYAELYLKLQPENLPVLVNLINLYHNTQRYPESLQLIEKFIDRAETLANRVAAYYLYVRNLMECGGNFDRAYLAHQKYEESLLKLIDSDLDSQTESYQNHIIHLIATVVFRPYIEDSPIKFYQLRQKSSAFLQSKLRDFFASRLTFSIESRRFDRSRHKKIKVGYLSSCLRRNSVGHLTRWTFQHHDRSQFEVYAYSLKQTNDEIQQFISTQVDRFQNVSLDKNVAEIAELIYQDKIDILVDLDSLTYSTGCAVMALKPAPIQMTWLGFDASEIPAIDYFLADPYVLPDAAQDYYSETIW
ncbi:MAG: sulfotransferase domain-containing protein, partial [Geitlerinemataceae cyanobacterium]